MNLQCNDLVVVSIGGHECRARITELPGEDDPPGVWVIGLDEDGDLLGSVHVPPDGLVRRVALTDGRGVEPLAIASAAATWIATVLPDHMALREIRYMLAGKLHKYLTDAWMGGCDGLEAE